MVRVNGLSWTADFTLARALLEAYRSSAKEEVVYLCVGDPDAPADALGPLVGTELAKYYPHVVGTQERPVTAETLSQAWQEVQSRWPNAFVIGIEAAEGTPEDLGFLEVSDRGLRRRPLGGETPPWLCDVGIAAYLWTGRAPERFTPAEFNRFQRLRDAVIDGQIRFLQKAKRYEPEL